MQFLPKLNCDRVAVGICVHRGRDGTGKESQCWTLPLYGRVQGNPLRRSTWQIREARSSPRLERWVCLSLVKVCLDVFRHSYGLKYVSVLTVTLPAQVFWKPPTTEWGACSSIFSLLMSWAVRTVSTWTSGFLRATLVIQTCSKSQDNIKSKLKG